ncbi:ABC transporter ATP-binding protein [Geobacillus sp. T6]|uniref:ATP-binding cassette domain-containing protein n=1 Tax=Geobacillus TaxID=129337 RepID=UPI00064A72B7|nr:MULTISPECIES: ATP-binding cassette domain-containing protein [Geobacillus]ASS98944.1 ABC transporter ATP-binding protein [Geobacillus thermocatenulatus]KLR73620.1 ABC transporter ATP-binding protein [Geobacillus sp. T6]
MAVVIEGLTKIVKKKPILSDVSLTLSGVYGLLGPNGAGKTTLMRIVAGLLEFNAGRVSLGDEPISTGARVKRVNEIGYLPQEFMMYPELTMYEVLEHLAVLQGEHPAACRSKIEKVIEQVNLSSHLNKKMRELSGGMRRRVGIAMLLLREPSILLFDEPTAGLDIRERVRFRNLLKRLGHDHTIVISSHLVEDIEFLCTKIGVLDRGVVLFEGSPDELKQKAAPYTYELDVPLEELDSVLAANEVVQMSEEPSHVVVRVLSEQPIGRPVAPRLMDGYLALLKEAEAHG